MPARLPLSENMISGPPVVTTAAGAGVIVVDISFDIFNRLPEAASLLTVSAVFRVSVSPSVEIELIVYLFPAEVLFDVVPVTVITSPAVKPSVV